MRCYKNRRAEARGKKSEEKMNAAVVSRYLPTSTAAVGASGGTRRDRVLPLWRTTSTPSLRSPAFRTRATVREGFARAATPSFYDLLGVPASCTLGEIKKAHKQLARKYHPDVSPLDRAEEHTRRFIEVQEAYETLSDSRSRALYDLGLSSGLSLAFSARRRFDEELEERSGWICHWKNQLEELKRMSMNDSKDNLSWGARMRRRRSESSPKEEVASAC
ncbi:chaperone protein dnaJ 20, chloroplastic [Canna indica]|uniref:Chaperone protein dnaJ 20, chloroplastic n=1 Tax=Canna indica TaxID=4628 RepID=A0AAQ3Q9B3_9LILI|nr:chaperone protein dnaJ 20, chloroplastic [Canna indica]